MDGGLSDQVSDNGRVRRELPAGRTRARYWHMTDEPEVPLTGGDMTAVVRVGDTVRRTAGPWTPAVHALLRHLRAAGFTQIPRAPRPGRAGA